MERSAGVAARNRFRSPVRSPETGQNSCRMRNSPCQANGARRAIKHLLPSPLIDPTELDRPPISPGAAGGKSTERSSPPISLAPNASSRQRAPALLQTPAPASSADRQVLHLAVLQQHVPEGRSRAEAEAQTNDRGRGRAAPPIPASRPPHTLRAEGPHGSRRRCSDRPRRAPGPRPTTRRRHPGPPTDRPRARPAAGSAAHRQDGCIKFVVMDHQQRFDSFAFGWQHVPL